VANILNIESKYLEHYLKRQDVFRVTKDGKLVIQKVF